MPASPQALDPFTASSHQTSLRSGTSSVLSLNLPDVHHPLGPWNRFCISDLVVRDLPGAVLQFGTQEALAVS